MQSTHWFCSFRKSPLSLSVQLHKEKRQNLILHLSGSKLFQFPRLLIAVFNGPVIAVLNGPVGFHVAKCSVPISLIVHSSNQSLGLSSEEAFLFFFSLSHLESGQSRLKARKHLAEIPGWGVVTGKCLFMYSSAWNSKTFKKVWRLIMSEPKECRAPSEEFCCQKIKIRTG